MKNNDTAQDDFQKNVSSKSLILVSLFSSLICIGAFIRIPLPLVSFTMQWFFVAMAGLLLGAKRGFLSVIVYIIIGLLGIPVFTKGGGISYIFQPTFGYIVGFSIAAYIIGKIVERKEKTFKNFMIANCIGLFFIYSIGFLHIYWVSIFILGKSVIISKLLQASVIMFIPSDLLSASLSAFISTKLYKAMCRANIY